MGGLYSVERKKADVEEIKILESKLRHIKAELVAADHKRTADEDSVKTNMTPGVAAGQEIPDEYEVRLKQLTPEVERMKLVRMLLEAERDLMAVESRPNRLHVTFDCLRSWFGLDTVDSQLIVVVGGMGYSAHRGIQFINEAIMLGKYLKVTDPELKSYYASWAMAARTKKRDFSPIEILNEWSDHCLHFRKRYSFFRGAALLSVPVSFIIYSCYKYAEIAHPSPSAKPREKCDNK